MLKFGQSFVKTFDEDAYQRFPGSVASTEPMPGGKPSWSYLTGNQF